MATATTYGPWFHNQTFHPQADPDRPRNAMGGENGTPESVGSGETKW